MTIEARNRRGFVRKPPDTENIPEIYCGGYCATYKKPSDVEQDTGTTYQLFTSWVQDSVTSTLDTHAGMSTTDISTVGGHRVLPTDAKHTGAHDWQNQHTYWKHAS